MMKEQDKITELFRANAHKLAQKPSDATWARLEQRLPRQSPITTRRAQSRPTGRRIQLQPLRIAAGLALLIGVSALFLWVLNDQDRRYQRAIAVADRPLEIEDLPMNAPPLPSPIVQKSLTKPYYAPQKTIEEGRPEQKLVARVTTKRDTTEYDPNSNKTDARQRMGR